MSDISLFAAVREQREKTGAEPCAFGIAMSRVPAKRWGTRSDVYDSVAAARAAIEAGFREPLSLSTLATVAGMSQYHFQRAYKGTYGVTPQETITQLRMQLAKSLLSRGGIPVGAVCVEVGYASLATFSRRFRAYFGSSPSAFGAQSARSDKRR